MSSYLILIVDDNELDLKLTRDVLRFEGFSTLEARTAHDALVLAREHQPDLIIMDVRLPDDSGVEVLRHLRSDPELAAVPCVALTALAMPGDERALLSAGFQAYLAKTVAVLELAGQLRQLLVPHMEQAPCDPKPASS